MRKSTILLTGIILVLTAVAAQAAQITVAQYRLGEDDAGAVAGGAGAATTVAAVGTDATLQSSGITYSSNTRGEGSTLSMSCPDTTGVYYKTTAVYDLGSDNWGIEGWVYSTDAANGGWAFTNGAYNFGQYNGMFWIERSDQGPVANSIAVAVNSWHKLGLERVDGVLTAYVDGVALATTNRSDDWSSAFSRAFTIGATGSGSETWAGLVDDVRLYKIVVPEPGTFTMLACGLIGLLAYAWRKRK